MAFVDMVRENMADEKRDGAPAAKSVEKASNSDLNNLGSRRSSSNSLKIPADMPVYAPKQCL